MIHQNISEKSILNRDLKNELRTLCNLSDEQCDKVLKWTESLPIIIHHPHPGNILAFIVQGKVNIRPC